jgi:hypothetical protein
MGSKVPGNKPGATSPGGLAGRLMQMVHSIVVKIHHYAGNQQRNDDKEQ